MPFKTVLAIVGTKNAVADINKAIELSLEAGAHLSVLALGLAISPMMTDYPVATAWLDQRQDDIDALVNVVKRAEDLCRTGGISFDVDYLYDEAFILESNVGMRAIYADVVIVGDGIRDDTDLTKTIIAGVVFDAHVPLVLTSKTGSASLRPKKILLAWNSRAEAARATKEALAMMTAADEVHITLVDPDNSYMKNGGEPGADIAAFLARHGIRAVVDQLASGGRNVEEVLEQHALEIGCDMIVMGAYGHSRLRERIFGGVTTSMIEKSKFPVFLAR